MSRTTESSCKAEGGTNNDAMGDKAPYQFIPELIEIGVDILNALQPNARDMELSRLKALHGERAAFFGGLDTQGIIPFGSLLDVETEVKRVIDAAAKGGGLILAGAHNIQPDVSIEKLTRIFTFAKQYGAYPLRQTAS